MKIAIIGTRGIPNRYGGFEQCAEYLAEGLVKKEHAVTVYSSHIHPYKENEWKGVRIIHCYNPEDSLSTVGLFIYDFNCIIHARREKYDVILMLGYTSSSVWGWLFPKKHAKITTNMDGLEWKRSKFSAPVRKFLKTAEALGVKFSDYLIADSIGIQQHLKEKYNKDSVYIPYGAHTFQNTNEESIKPYKISPYTYNMLIARLEPENSVDIILDGIVLSGITKPFLVIGSHETKYGEYLKKKFKNYPNILFTGGIYDINVLNNLRYFSNIYFHGHTVGGTNPSLLEAMASGALICAHNNVFNKSILGDDALYFENSTHVSENIKTVNKQNETYKQYLASNMQKIKNYYSWERIVNLYETHFIDITGKRIVRELKVVRQ